MLRQDDFISSSLVLVGYRYGLSYGGHLAACLVMNCLANRFRLGWGSWLEVIERIPNFAAENEMPNQNKYPSIWDQNFVRLLHEVTAIKDGSGKDLANGGLYWCDLRHVERSWFQNSIIDAKDDEGKLLHNRVADMNSFVIFR